MDLAGIRLSTIPTIHAPSTSSSSSSSSCTPLLSSSTPATRHGHSATVCKTRPHVQHSLWHLPPLGPPGVPPLAPPSLPLFFFPLLALYVPLAYPLPQCFHHPFPRRSLATCPIIPRLWHLTFLQCQLVPRGIDLPSRSSLRPRPASSAFDLSLTFSTDLKIFASPPSSTIMFFHLSFHCVTASFT